jgi:hypothetical protein
VGELLDCPLGGFKIFEVTIDIKSGLKNDLPLLTSGLGGLGMGAGSLRGRSSGLRHLEFGSGLLSNSWCAAFDLSEEQYPQKIFEPPAKEKPHTQRTTTICLSRLQPVKTKSIAKKMRRVGVLKVGENGVMRKEKKNENMVWWV